ncbi:hypothetical protein EYF80_052100 [Liparis tanakae]|uniref:Uncharacterized protein n=1 Tax=Liparis tanakae TaxID=230148 RepID=A0A4Z2FA10_9TELE|nr:hypothetical protein EYF80_052100 [Liparis tanakae]
MPLSPLGGGGAAATGLRGAPSTEPPVLRCLQVDLAEEDEKPTVQEKAGATSLRPLLTVGGVGAEADGALPVSGGDACRQRLPQLQGEGALPLRELQPRDQLRGREAPPLLIPVAAA